LAIETSLRVSIGNFTIGTTGVDLQEYFFPPDDVLELGIGWIKGT
jgi:hypothetical protein